MQYLKKYVKFRLEDGYVLLCDCSTIQNYELPLEALKILEKLKKGYDIQTNKPTELEKDLISDFETLNLIDNIPNSNNGFHDNEWISLGYDENEFYK